MANYPIECDLCGCVVLVYETVVRDYLDWDKVGVYKRICNVCDLTEWKRRISLLGGNYEKWYELAEEKRDQLDPEVVVAYLSKAKEAALGN